jgi:hypothetical protein
VELADPDMTLGSFNETLDGKSFLKLEESCFPADHARAGRLKAVITASLLHINPKGRSPYSIGNTLHCLLTTNEKWAVPAGAGARRFLVLDVVEKMDGAYFDAFGAEADHGGIACALWHLLRVKNPGAGLRDVPITQALVQQQRQTADDFTQWVTDCILCGQIVPSSSGMAGISKSAAIGGFGAEHSLRSLCVAFATWAALHGRRSKSAREIGKALRALGLSLRPSNGEMLFLIPDRQTLLQLSDRRAGIHSR